MKWTWKPYVIAVSILTLILGGCSQDMNVSAEEILHNAIESEKDVTRYKGISEMKTKEGEDLTEHLILEEYVDDQQRKVITTDQILEQETVAFNDGERMLMYDEARDEAYEMDVTELGDIAGLSPKEQFKNMMEMVGDSHSYEMIGEEKILDFDTYHIQLTADDSDQLLGDMELWIDQKTWFVVKMISETGGIQTEVTYTELDFSPEFTEDTFTIDIPEDVDIADLEDDFAPDTVTLEEATEALDQAFFIFPEEGDEMGLTDIQMYGVSNEEARSEVILSYSNEEGIPVFSLSVFPTPENMEIEKADLEIRGNKAEYQDMIDGILWDEDGLRYSIVIEDPNLDQETIGELAEEMVLSTEE